MNLYYSKLDDLKILTSLYHRSNNQRFQEISAGNGYFIFKNLKSETVIDVYN